MQEELSPRLEVYFQSSFYFFWSCFKDHSGNNEEILFQQNLFLKRIDEHGDDDNPLPKSIPKQTEKLCGSETISKTENKPGIESCEFNLKVERN